MTKRYSAEMTGVLDGTLPVQRADPASVNSKRRSVIATIVLAAQANGDTISLGKRPIGSRWLSGSIITDTSLGSSTVAIGVSGTAAKYKAAATLTATDTPTGFSKAAAEAAAPLTTEEEILLTIGAADFPSSGNLVVRYDYTAPA